MDICPTDDDKNMTLSVTNALSPTLRFTESVDVVVSASYIDNAVDDSG